MNFLTRLLNAVFRPGRNHPLDTAIQPMDPPLAPVAPPAPVAPSAPVQQVAPAPASISAAPGSSGFRKGTLAFLLGPVAAGILFYIIPEEESGRKVDVQIAADGTPTIKHVSGRQYLNTYLDIAGIPTACDGLTDRQKIKLGVSFTEAQCALMLEEALVRHAEGMLKCSPGFDPKAHPYQTVGLVSLTYNIGIGGYCRSSIRRNVVAGNLLEACDRILLYNKGRIRGVLQPVRGLTLRRERERQYCLTGLKPGHTVENLKRRLAPFK